MNENKEFWALHAVIFKKPYDIEKAKEEVKDFIKNKKHFYRETTKSYRFRNINKGKFIKGQFKTKKINPNISVILGQLKPEFSHLEGAGLFDLFKKPIQKVREFFSPRQGYNNTTTKNLNNFGSLMVQRLMIVRTPILSILDKAVNVISLGKWSKLKKEYGYDKLFHLALVANVGGKNLVIEKNEVINVNTEFKMSSNSETMDINITGKKFNISQMLDKTRTRLGDTLFFGYEGFTNNCQVFIRECLVSEGLYGEKEQNFLFQDLSQLVQKFPSLSRKIMNAITHTGAVVNKITGKGEPENKGLEGFNIISHDELLNLLSNTGKKKVIEQDLVGGGITEDVKKFVDSVPKNVKNIKNTKIIFPRTAVATFFYLYYLFEKHNNCYALFKKYDIPDNKTMRDIEVNISTNASYGWTFIKKGNKFLQYLNTDVEQLKEVIENCKKDFIIIPLSFIKLSKFGNFQSGHQNFIIIDINNKTIERFEPHGSNLIYKYNVELSENTNNFLSALSKELNYNYISPEEITPELNEETYNEFKFKYPQSKKIGLQTFMRDNIGLCVAVSYFYADLRLNNPDYKPTELLQEFIKLMDEKPQEVLYFIKNYADYLSNFIKTKFKDYVNNLHDVDVNTYKFISIQFQELIEKRKQVINLPKIEPKSTKVVNIEPKPTKVVNIEDEKHILLFKGIQTNKTYLFLDNKKVITADSFKELKVLSKEKYGKDKKVRPAIVVETTMSPNYSYKFRLDFYQMKITKTGNIIDNKKTNSMEHLWIIWDEDDYKKIGLDRNLFEKLYIAFIEKDFYIPVKLKLINIKDVLKYIEEYEEKNQ